MAVATSNNHQRIVFCRSVIEFPQTVSSTSRIFAQSKTDLSWRILEIPPSITDFTLLSPAGKFSNLQPQPNYASSKGGDQVYCLSVPAPEIRRKGDADLAQLLRFC